MAGKCDLCEKHTTFGRNIRHKHSGRWQREGAADLADVQAQRPTGAGS